MKTGALCLVLSIGCGMATTAVAEPCVSATFDKPLEGAVNVVTRQADVPSPQFPGLWQEGRLGGFFYALFANLEGVLKATRNAPEWEVKIACPTDGQDCAITAEGQPPADAQALVQVLSLCLQGVTPPAPPPPEAIPEPTAPCGLATVPKGQPVAVLQSLLKAAGADPGPVDGIMGGNTLKALEQVLGRSATTLAVPGAIAALDRFMCQKPQ